MRFARVLAAVLAAAAVAPAAAAAHGAAPWAGTYQVQLIGGSQEATWTLSRPSGNPCLGGESGQGSDAQSFVPGAPAVVQLAVGGSAFAASIPSLELRIAEDRQGSITRGPPADSNPGDCIGEATESPAPPASDCAPTPFGVARDRPGSRHGSGRRLRVRPDAIPGLPRIRRRGTRVRFPRDLLDAAARTRVGGGPPTGDATLEATAPITDPGVSGSTTLRVRLRFTRLAVVVEPLAMAQDPTITASPSEASTSRCRARPAHARGRSRSVGSSPNATFASVRTPHHFRASRSLRPARCRSSARRPSACARLSAESGCTSRAGSTMRERCAAFSSPSTSPSEAGARPSATSRATPTSGPDNPPGAPR